MSTADPLRPFPSLAAWALVAVASAARFLFLDADPKLEFWVGYITDEGRWVEAARNLALFGEPRLYSLSKLHLVLSPGYQAVTYAFFELFGVHLWSARLWTATCGAALVVVVALLLGRTAPGLPQLLAIAVVGFEPLTLGLARTALPEVPSLFLMVCAFFAIISGQRRVARAALGGFLLSVSLSMKLTSALVAPAFVLMILFSGTRETLRERLRRLAAFMLGAGLPALVALAVAFGAGVVSVSATSDIEKPILQALDHGGPFVLLWRYFFSSAEQANVILLLLGAWVGTWVLPFWRRFRGTPLGELYLHSGLWSATWILVVGPLEYTPWRYSVHCIVPLALHVAAGLALWREIGPIRVFARWCESDRRWRLASFAWICLPAALIFAAPALELVELAGWRIERLSHRLAFVGAILAIFVLVGRFVMPAERTCRAFIVFTVGVALIEALADALYGWVFPLATSGSVLPYARLAVITACAIGIAAFSRVAGEWPERSRANSLAAGAALSALALQGLPTVLAPTFTLRDASLDLGQRFAGARVLRSIAAGSMMLETTIPYRDEEAYGVDFDGLVSPVRNLPVPPSFVPETTYFLVAHPRYRIASRYAMESGRIRVDVFRGTVPENVSNLPQ